MGIKATRRTEVNIAARKWRNEAEESTRSESDEREREGQQGAAKPGRYPATVSVEKKVNDAIVVEASGEEVGIRPQGGRRSI